MLSQDPISMGVACPIWDKSGSRFHLKKSARVVPIGTRLLNYEMEPGRPIGSFRAG